MSKTAVILRGYVRKLEDKIDFLRSQYGDDMYEEGKDIFGRASKYIAKDTDVVVELKEMKECIEDDMRYLIDSSMCHCGSDD